MRTISADGRTADWADEKWGDGQESFRWTPQSQFEFVVVLLLVMLVSCLAPFIDETVPLRTYLMHRHDWEKYAAGETQLG
eukprot:scaffold1973_cov92-Skeletonema_dohrnii-CCMP3373.AAC.3